MTAWTDVGRCKDPRMKRVLQSHKRNKREREKKSSYMFPGDSFSLVLFLFLLEDQLDEELLQFLVAVVDAELFKAAGRKEGGPLHCD